MALTTASPAELLRPFRPPRVLMLVLAAAAFAILTTAIMTRSPKWLTDFDQAFYLTIAYDLDRHGVFSNGVFDTTDSTVARPPPGIFFGPLYPALVFAAMKVDPRFAESVACVVESAAKKRDPATCEVYARPMHLAHGLFLALGVVAIAAATHLLGGGRLAVAAAGALATLALLSEAELFSFLMTESVSFALYGATATAMLAGWVSRKPWIFAVAGLLLGALCLLRPSFAILVPAFALLTLLGPRVFGWARPRLAWGSAAVVVLACALVVGPWIARNAAVAGKFALTEEYGSAALIERFAFNTMTAREFALAFPYCLPVVGPALVARAFGPAATARFEWNAPGSFFEAGRARRLALVETHGRLDPVIRQATLAEFAETGWRHIAVALPLAWCGMWVGGVLGLALVPLFVAACMTLGGTLRYRLLFFAAPAFAMLGLHGLVANHYTRYNLILIGPLSVAGAWMIVSLFAALRERREPSA